MAKIYGIGRLEMDYTPAVYRECRDKACPAFRLDLPHSHFENEPIDDAELERFKAKWDSLDFSGTATVVHTDGTTEEVRPTLETSSVHQWVSVPIDDPAWLMQKVGNYITWIETGLTAEVCRCERIPHPTKPNVFSGETSLECPAHSKEGLVLGFIEWLKRNGD